ncbi:MAG: hypothetical protein ACK5S6_04815 [bacterium]
MGSRGPKTSTFWSRTFDKAKMENGWFVVERRYSKRTAQSLACDIRSSHRRSPTSKMPAGLKPDDKWDAICELPDDPAEESWNCVVAIKYKGKRKTNRWRN